MEMHSNAIVEQTTESCFLLGWTLRNKTQDHQPPLVRHFGGAKVNTLTRLSVYKGTTNSINPSPSVSATTMVPTVPPAYVRIHKSA
jgi:hypothetical protein